MGPPAASYVPTVRSPIGEHSIVVWRSIGIISISQYGIDEVETAERDPQQPTTNFPPLNILIAGSINNSPVQQGTAGSTQSVTMSSGDRDTIAALLKELKATVAALQLSEEARADAEAQLATVEAQLRASKPKPGIIRESLGYLADILKTAGAAASVLEALKLVISGLGGG